MPFPIEMRERYPRSNRRYQSMRPLQPRIGTHRRNKQPTPKELNVSHEDQILDVSYDHHGSRIATCSLDQWVRIWDMDFGSRWHCNGAWKAHSGPIWKVTWADPEFGQVVATASFDRTVCIWEETTSRWGKDVRLHSIWIKRYTFTENASFGSVSDFKFAPSMYGLACAMISEDGYIRVFEAPDLLNVSYWLLNWETTLNRSLSAFSWCKSVFRLQCPLFAIASDDPDYDGSQIEIFEHNQYTHEFQAICAKDWKGVFDIVRDISFQSNFARRDDLLAVVTPEYLQLIYVKLVEDDDGSGPNQGNYITHIGPYTKVRLFDIHTEAILRDNFAPLWRTAWSYDGSVVITASEEGIVRLYRCLNNGRWVCWSINRPGISMRNIAYDLYMELTTEEGIEVTPNMRFD